MFSASCDHPDTTALADACDEIAALAERTCVEGPWRSGAFAVLARRGVLAGFIPRACGGSGAGEVAILEAIAAIAERCLTTALALTQWASAVRIIAGGPADVREARLPALAAGAAFTTVGISQLTTSRQHVGGPTLAAVSADGRWRLDGLCPWVTGADSSDTIVTGAATPDGGQMFFIVPTDAAGLAIDPPLRMLALSGSRTSAVRFQGVVPAAAIRPAGPGGPRTGGLATTATALGATRASLALVRREAAARADLEPIAAGLDAEAAGLHARLRQAAGREVEAADRDRLRAEATSLAVRAAQAALTASKGAGFVRGHPAERLVREAHFFLVWSCPQAVSSAVLCALAGID